MYDQSVDLLNRAVGDELDAIHQYMYFHFHLDDQGLGRLAMLFKRTAIEEMLHMERIADRILFLKGDIVMKPASEVQPIQDPRAMLEAAAKAETAAIRMYNEMAKACGDHMDSNTKKLFEDLVTDEERHYSQFDDELEKIAKYGDNYLALQAMGGQEPGAGGA